MEILKTMHVLLKGFQYKSGFILHLEDLENRPFLQKLQGKPGKVREFSIIFIQVRE